MLHVSAFPPSPGSGHYLPPPGFVPMLMPNTTFRAFLLHAYPWPSYGV